MSDFWQELIKSLGGFAILAVSLAWLTKSIVVHFLSKDVEAYKSRIASEAAKEIEQFKAQLQIVAREHDIRFSKLHEKRAEVISELYALLTDANGDTQLLDFVLQLGPLTGEEDKFDEEKARKIQNEVAEETADKCTKLADFFNQHKLYFNEELSERMENLISVLSKPSTDYRLRHQFGVGEPHEVRSEIVELLRNELPNIQQILKLLEKDFRTLLGSDNESIISPSTVDKEGKDIKK